MIVAAAAIAYGLVTHRRAQAAALCSPACPSADVAVTYYGWSGSTSFVRVPLADVHGAVRRGQHANARQP